MTTSTPKTDAAQFIQHDMTAVVDADFARELERELAIERARLDWILRLCETGVFYRAESRAAIAAAMKEEA